MSVFFLFFFLCRLEIRLPRVLSILEAVQGCLFSIDIIMERLAGQDMMVRFTRSLLQFFKRSKQVHKGWDGGCFC